MREAIEQVIAELKQKLDDDSITSIEYLNGYIDGRRTIAELVIYKLKDVLSNETTNESQVPRKENNRG